MSFLLFVLILLASVTVVQIGAIALELTGLDQRVARFQALSCFTGTGFTTREAEVITVSPRRRKIASVLMIVGFAGFVTLIGTFAVSVKDHTTILQFPLNFLTPYINPKYYTWINLGFYLIVGFALWRLFKNSRLIARFNTYLRKKLEHKELITPAGFDEVMVATGGWTVCRLEIRENTPANGKTLHELGLRKHSVYPLAIERQNKTIPMPTAENRLQLDDLLVCFGKLTSIREVLLGAS